MLTLEVKITQNQVQFLMGHPDVFHAFQPIKTQTRTPNMAKRKALSDW